MSIALFCAVKTGDVALVNQYLDADHNCNYVHEGKSLLQYAAEGDKPEILEALIRKGAQASQLTAQGDTLLMLALRGCSKTNMPVISKLLESEWIKGNLNHQNQAGESALSLATQGRSFEIMQLLLANDADPGRKPVDLHLLEVVIRRAGSESKGGAIGPVQITPLLDKGFTVNLACILEALSHKPVNMPLVELLITHYQAESATVADNAAIMVALATLDAKEVQILQMIKLYRAQSYPKDIVHGALFLDQLLKRGIQFDANAICPGTASWLSSGVSNFEYVVQNGTLHAIKLLLGAMSAEQLVIFNRSRRKQIEKMLAANIDGVFSRYWKGLCPIKIWVGEKEPDEIRGYPREFVTGREYYVSDWERKAKCWIGPYEDGNYHVYSNMVSESFAQAYITTNYHKGILDQLNHEIYFMELHHYFVDKLRVTKSKAEELPSYRARLADFSKLLQFLLANKEMPNFADTVGVYMQSATVFGPRSVGFGFLSINQSKQNYEKRRDIIAGMPVDIIRPRLQEYMQFLDRRLTEKLDPVEAEFISAVKQVVAEAQASAQSTSTSTSSGPSLTRNSDDEDDGL